MSNRKPHITLACPTCKQYFTQHRASQKFCSVKCRDAAARATYTKKHKDRILVSARRWQERNRKAYYTPEKRAYYSARHRCMNHGAVNYQEYGGRGIEFKFADFAAFIAELGPRPDSNHVLDRINNNGNYEAGNIKWSTKADSNRNRRKRFRSFGKPKRRRT